MGIVVGWYVLARVSLAKVVVDEPEAKEGECGSAKEDEPVLRAVCQFTCEAS